MVCLLVVIGLVILVLHGKSSFKGFNGECSITCPMAKKVKVLCFSFLSLDNVYSFASYLPNCSDLIGSMSGYRHLMYSQMPVDLESPEPFWLGSQAPDDSPSKIPPECPSQIPPECPSQVPDQSRRQVPDQSRSHGRIGVLLFLS
ncbi:hypothetical protein HID58_033250 [Brassica napus]|uniref:Uncharacterized protein n=1 Tax=Brassica napus TaxID=3708 RepID=A0ABQ8BYX4_BRANA|nr:hypothetical protein HID58_033250 [Brassica napus]